MTQTELPQAIRDAIESNYAGYQVDDIEMIWQNKNTTYKVELETGQDEKHITFDGNAKVLNERAH